MKPVPGPVEGWTFDRDKDDGGVVAVRRDGDWTWSAVPFLSPSFGGYVVRYERGIARRTA